MSTSPRSRTRLLREVALLIALYLAYSLGRSFVDSGAREAFVNGAEVLRLERLFGIDVEGDAARWLADWTGLSVVAAYLYATLHYTVTPAVLIWLYRRHPQRYGGARTVLVLSTAAALVCYWLVPVAPPRLLSSHYPDVMALTSQFGWWGAQASAPRGLGGLTNQFAALPSMHVGWAVWCALVVVRTTSSRVLRAVAVAYPLLMTVVVVATSNHYVVDAAAGAAVVALAAIGVGLGHSPAVHRRRAHGAVTAPDRPVVPAQERPVVPV